MRSTTVVSDIVAASRAWGRLVPGASAVCREINTITSHYGRAVPFSREHNAYAGIIGTVTDYLLGLRVGDTLEDVVARVRPFIAGWSDTGRPLPEMGQLDYDCAELFLARLQSERDHCDNMWPPTGGLVRLLAVLARFDALYRGGALPGGFTFVGTRAARKPAHMLDAVLESVIPRSVEAEIVALSIALVDTLPRYREARYGPSLSAREAGVAADGDVRLDDTLFELKCVKRFRPDHVRQLVAYGALVPLSVHSGAIEFIGFLNPYFWLRWRVSLGELFEAAQADPEEIRARLRGASSSHPPRDSAA